jgi:hypothetical protein
MKLLFKLSVDDQQIGINVVLMLCNTCFEIVEACFFKLSLYIRHIYEFCKGLKNVAKNKQLRNKPIK